ncbi:Lrp/AsnC family transcriptional regulator [Chachezhania antarctica]|uniref:Lrp/AsnC family transcriptional regulator n=1 Tax=Chachezhania antarctica TaxID=2340860 RepID=UPI000EB091C9|nr:Lrp/AsnC family transcriptional regulator [Chachezhania antarctica]
MLDDTDRRILRQYQAEPGAPVADLAARAGVTPSTWGRRLERMERAGVIEGLEAVIDWRALGYEITVSLRFTLDKTVPRAFEDFLEAARAIPEVLELQTFVGRVDVRLLLLARDMGHYQRLYREKILTLPHIVDIDALMHIAQIKNEDRLPL